MFRRTTRGSSISVEYMLTLLIALSLLGGVSVAVDNIDDRQEEQIVEDQLELAGNEIAVQLEHQYMLLERTKQAEPLAAAIGSDSSLEFTSEYHVDTPKRIASGAYSAQITSNGESITMSPSANIPAVEVPLRSEIPVRAGSGASGGQVIIVYDAAESEFVLRSDTGGGS